MLLVVTPLCYTELSVDNCDSRRTLVLPTPPLIMKFPRMRRAALMPKQHFPVNLEFQLLRPKLIRTTGNNVTVRFHVAIED